LPDLVALNDIKAPTLTIVGQVVRLHDRLSWFSPQARGTSAPIKAS
jgi:siroheme synthase